MRERSRAGPADRIHEIEVQRCVAECAEESARLVRELLKQPTDEPIAHALNRLLTARWPDRSCQKTV